MEGSMIVIEGLDGCGKHTQSELLLSNLNKRLLKTDIELIDFPRHGKTSFYTGDAYLKGEFGSDPNLVDSYLGSLFYATDRGISYKTEKWGTVYNNGGIVICDRYTTSNIFHQGSKFATKPKYMNPSLIVKDIYDNLKFREYIHWLYDLEFNKLRLPIPNLIVVLEAPEQANVRMLINRRIINGKYIKFHDDIHENNHEYLTRCRAAQEAYKMIVLDNEGEFVFERRRIRIPHAFISVTDNLGNIRTKESINEEIISKIMYYGLV